MEEEVKVAEPRAEVDWDPAALLKAKHVTVAHPALAQAKPSKLAVWLKSLAASSLDSSVRGLTAFGFSPHVFITDNFARTVELTTASSDPFHFLRAVDFVLELCSGELLLLSDREADAILPLAWKAVRARLRGGPGTGHRDSLAQVLSLPWSVAAPQPFHDRPPGLRLSNWCFRRGNQLQASTGSAGADIAVASVQLFNGESPLCPDPADPRLGSLRAILASPAAKDAASCLPRARGLLHLFSYSSMEDICVLRRS